MKHVALRAGVGLREIQCDAHRLIMIAVRERGQGKNATYSWDFYVEPDRIHDRCNNHDLPSEEAARVEALHDARWRIDHLKPLPDGAPKVE